MPTGPPSTPDSTTILEQFSCATAAWFRSAFPAPTAAQAGAWAAISANHHALVVAPTGSGKTLSAFLWSIDQLISTPELPSPPQSVQILYVSPLKALAADIERNLQAPLVGIGHSAARLGLTIPDITVGTRTGDTPANERRTFAQKPPHILITTPESLFLLLTAKARTALRGVTTVIIDEIHALAGTKRGAHLGLSLERLDELTTSPVQRIGLSATVAPVSTVAEYLTGTRTPGDDGGRSCTIVQPPAEKKWDLHITVPLADMATLGEPTGDLSGLTAGAPKVASIWPHIEHHIVDQIDPIKHPNTATLVFTNARRSAERLTNRLNEEWHRRQHPQNPVGDDAAVDRMATNPENPPARHPVEVIGHAATATAAPAELARAHHGSVAKEHRKDIEEALKSGQLPAVVATSSLELGIDMGSINTVLQISPPPSVAAGLQRIGRAGHQVGATSHGVIYPKHRSELLAVTTITERMKTGDLEPLTIPQNPLDVLAQQIIAMVAMDDYTTEELYTIVRRATAYATLTEAVCYTVVDMLAGRYPSHEFAELRPRITWDRSTNILSARPGAARLAVTSGGTIPDRGLFGVFLATADSPGKRVGELDEEMVYESRVGDVFTLGSSTWRIEEITYDRVLVTPAPGQPARLPFWRGENQGRPLALGTAIGQLTRELLASPGGHTGHVAQDRLRAAGLDDNAVANTTAYLTEQLEAIGYVPTDTTLVLERFRDELGDWRIVLHSPFGMAVHAPWAQLITAELTEQLGLDVQVMPHDDGIVLRLPDTISSYDYLDPTATPETTACPEPTDNPLTDTVTAAIWRSPENLQANVTATIADSALFAARFRECAGRALLMPRRNPGKRQPLWQQRQRAAQLLSVAIKYPTFPIVLETVRECLQDVYDVPGLEHILRRIQSGAITVVDVAPATASPFAKSILFGYVAQFLYEGDSPLAERRAAALALDPELLADLLGNTEGTALADLLDPDAVWATHQELTRTSGDRPLRSAEDLADLLRILGPLSPDAIASRTTAERTHDVPDWAAELARSKRTLHIQLAGREVIAAIEDAGYLRDALGVPLPLGVPAAFTEPTTDPLAALIGRFSRTRAIFTAAQIATEFGLGIAVVTDVLNRMTNRKELTCGRLLPEALYPTFGLAEHDPTDNHYANVDVLRRLRRRSLAALRQETEPVPEEHYAAFLPSWQNITVRTEQGYHGGLRGLDGLYTAVEQLAGSKIPASALETLVLPARVPDYTPALLDELCTAGEVHWIGRGSLAGTDGWVSLHPADSVPYTRVPPGELTRTPVHDELLAHLASGAAYYLHQLVSPEHSESAYTSALWDLVWAGYVTGDTLAPLRALTNSAKTAHKSPRKAPRGRIRRSAWSRPALTGQSLRAPQTTAGRVAEHLKGRWSLLPEVAAEPTHLAKVRADVLLHRYGVLTRGSVQAEDSPGGFAGIYPVLRALEEHGTVRRGYFVDGRGASQFATPGAVDRLRVAPEQHVVVLAACDPANPFGAALPWPEPAGAHTKHKPGRKAGALVGLVSGHLGWYLERGAKTLLICHDDCAALHQSATELVRLVLTGRLRTVTIETINGEPALHAPQEYRDALLAAGFHLTPKGLRARR